MTTELPDVEVFDIFAIDEHGHLWVPPPPPADPPDLLAAGESAVRHLQEVRATPGHRLGNDPGHLVRTGLAEEISQPLLAPAAAVIDRVVHDPSVFAGLPRLCVDPSSRRSAGATAVWETELDTGPPSGSRPATMRIRPTPSNNVTVIELVPVRPRRFRTKTFVRLGVTAIAELGRRLGGAHP